MVTTSHNLPLSPTKYHQTIGMEFDPPSNLNIYLIFLYDIFTDTGALLYVPDYLYETLFKWIGIRY